MRAHGTRACYMFGPDRGSDSSKGCRCLPCTDANRDYARLRATGQVSMVGATEARRHIAWLASQGVGARAIQAASRVSRSTVRAISHGRPRIRASVAEAILLVFPVDAAPRAHIPAGPTWLLLDELLAQGYTKTYLAAELGSKAKTPALQISREQVTAENAKRVRELHRRLLLPVLVDRENAAARRRAHRERQRAAA